MKENYLGQLFKVNTVENELIHIPGGMRGSKEFM